ncbi:MAG: hypothetical protein OXF86_21015 [Caldilineaceae bacterium]|nr:hypothetical protein [Caldilineaceae bacterium]
MPPSSHSFGDWLILHTDGSTLLLGAAFPSGALTKTEELIGILRGISSSLYK